MRTGPLMGQVLLFLMIRLNQNIPFVRATLSGSIGEAAGILRDAERRYGLRFSAGYTEEAPEDEGWYRRHLWPFLSETHFVISGGDLQGTGYSLTGEDGLDYMGTWRSWGGVLAEWANEHWVQRPRGLGMTRWTRAARRWEYLDFYMDDNLSYLIADYEVWVQRIGAVLRHEAHG